MASIGGCHGSACAACPTCLWSRVVLKPLCLCGGQAVDRMVLEDEGGHLSLPSLPSLPWDAGTQLSPGRMWWLLFCPWGRGVPLLWFYHLPLWLCSTFISREPRRTHSAVLAYFRQCCVSGSPVRSHVSRVYVPCWEPTTVIYP